MKLKEFLEKNNIWHKFHEKGKVAESAEDSAKLLGIGIEHVIKSILLLDKHKNPYLAVVHGSAKIDYAKAKKAFVISKVRLCPVEKTKEYCGYERGATPPICPGIKVAVDASLLSRNHVFGGGGNKYRILEIHAKDIVKWNSAIVADLIQ